jgi:hypothetical protein
VGQQAYVRRRTGRAVLDQQDIGGDRGCDFGLAALPSRRRGRGHAIDEATATVTEFSGIDTRARDYLKSGRALMAGDIFTEGSDAAATAVRQIETARQAQHQAVEVDVAAVRKQQMLTAASAAGGVCLIVLLLIPAPRARAPYTVATGVSIGPSAARDSASAPAPVGPTTLRA